ncbi:MAG: DNA repair protein RecN [Coriobacteriia bacterium]
MLEELRVRDLALIEEAWLEFGPGMTVLTGETGAGKTALVGALKLLVGARADSTVVRSGCPETQVEGRFATPYGESLVRRRLSADGRSRCTMNGEMVTVSELAEALGPLVDLHGQHDHQALLSPVEHAAYLDRYIGEPAIDARRDYVEARAVYARTRGEIERLRQDIAESARQKDYLSFVISEIQGVDPLPGEDEDIERRLPALKHADRLSATCAEALAALRSDDGATDSIAAAGAALSRASGLDPALDTLAERLADIEGLLGDMANDLRGYAENIEHDPVSLDALLGRLSSLADLKKKHGPTLEDVMRTRDEAAAHVEAVASGDSLLSQATARLEAAGEALREAGERLASVHAQAAPRFVQALAEATADLEMPGVRFEIAADDVPFESWPVEGPQRIEFMYAPARDVPARPLAKIASGGEISRVMLALKGVLGSADEVPVLVFDEVDSGIGGAAAIAVGRRLKDLSARHQVLVVTHLPQVAVFADAHLVVDKDMTDGGVRTTVTQVAGDEREAEIARMLSGSDTEASRAHARELLSGSNG